MFCCMQLFYSYFVQAQKECATLKGAYLYVAKVAVIE